MNFRRPKKRDKSVMPWLAAAIAVLLVFLVLIGVGVVNNGRFRDFKENLQADVDYARNGGHFEYVMNGQPVSATFRTPDAILFALSEAGPGKPFKGGTVHTDAVPGSSGDMSVTFGNGNILYIMETEVIDGDGNSFPGILVSYVSGGKVYAYDTPQLQFSKIKAYITQFELK